MRPDHLYRESVQPGEHLGLDDVVGGSDRYLAASHVDDRVHHLQQRVHVVRGQQHGDVLVPAQLREQSDDAPRARDVQVRQRLVEQQQPRLADQRVRDHHALLLAAGQLADPRVLVAERADGLEHRLGPSGPLLEPAGQRDAEAGAVDAQRHHVLSAERDVLVDRELLRHITDVRAPGHHALGGGQQTQDDAEQRGLARAVRPDQAGELTRPDGQRNVAEYLPALGRRAEAQADVVKGDQGLLGPLPAGFPCRRLHKRLGHRCSVDSLSDTALASAFSSASIHD